MMVGLAFVGERTVIFLFTEKWLPCVPLLYASCISYGVNPFRAINMQLVYAMGNAKKATMIEICRFIIGISWMLVGVFVLKLPLVSVALIGSNVAIVVVLITQFVVKGYIGYSFREFFADIAAPLMMSAIMAAFVYLVGQLQLNNLLVLILQVATGVAVYAGLSVVTKNPNLSEALTILNGMRGK